MEQNSKTPSKAGQSSPVKPRMNTRKTTISISFKSSEQTISQSLFLPAESMIVIVIEPTTTSPNTVDLAKP